jgi:hypothetical protein
VFAGVLVAIQTQKLRNAKPGMQKKEKHRLVPEWLLMMPMFESDELLSSPFEGYHLIIRKALPGRLVGDKLFDPFAGVSREKTSALLNPAGKVAQGRKDAIDARGLAFPPLFFWAFSDLRAFKPTKEGSRDGLGPVIDMEGVALIFEEGQKKVEVPLLGLLSVLRFGRSFQVFVDFSPCYKVCRVFSGKPGAQVAIRWRYPDGN